MTNSLTTQTGKDASLVQIRMDKNRFPRLAAIPEDAAIVQMTRIIHGAFMYKGYKSDEMNNRFIAANLIKELMERNEYGAKYLTFEEIGRVIKNAILNDPEFIGISVSSLYRLLINYAKKEGAEAQDKADALAKQRREKELKDSMVAPMIQIYAGKMLMNNKK